MTVKLRCVVALLVTVAGCQITVSRTASAEEVGDGWLQAAAYDVVIVPRAGRASRSRIWTDQGWAALPDQRRSTRDVPRGRAALPWDDPRRRGRDRAWTDSRPNAAPWHGGFARDDRSRTSDGRRGTQRDEPYFWPRYEPRSAWRPRYTERQF